MRGDFFDSAMQYRDVDLAAQRRAEEEIMTDLDREGKRLGVDLSNSRAVAKAIRAALSERSAIRWSVTCGRGTSYGWIYIDVPKSYAGRSVAHEVRTKLCTDLCRLLGFDWLTNSCAEYMVPAAQDYRAEYLARARGEKPVIMGKPYWD